MRVKIFHSFGQIYIRNAFDFWTSGVHRLDTLLTGENLYYSNHYLLLNSKYQQGHNQKIILKLPGEYRRGTSGWQLVPRHSTGGGGDRDGHLLVLPGKQVLQDHGILQEHGAPVRDCHPRRGKTYSAGWGSCAWWYCWGENEDTSLGHNCQNARYRHHNRRCVAKHTASDLLSQFDTPALTLKRKQLCLFYAGQVNTVGARRSRVRFPLGPN